MSYLVANPEDRFMTHFFLNFIALKGTHFSFLFHVTRLISQLTQFATVFSHVDDLLFFLLVRSSIDLQ